MGHHDWRPVPILPCTNPMATAEFWSSLGFRVVDASPDSTPYLIAVRQGAELHFATDPDVAKADARAACYVQVPDATAVHAEWSALGLPATGPGSLGRPEVRPWGLLEFWVTDPDRTVVRFGSHV
jgi:hypothetical protein